MLLWHSGPDSMDLFFHSTFGKKIWSEYLQDILFSMSDLVIKALSMVEWEYGRLFNVSLVKSKN